MNDFQQEKEIKEFRFDAEKVAQELAKALKVPYFDLRVVKPEVDALQYVPQDLAKKAKAIPIKKERNNLVLGVIDPYSEEFLKLKKDLENQGLNVKLAIISPLSLETGLKHYRFLEEKKLSYSKIFEINEEIFKEVQKTINKKEDLKNVFQQVISTNPFFFLDYLLASGVKFNASDIHFEPKEKEILIRYRLDGILYDIFVLPSKFYNLIKNRIKVLAGMMINITDKPQDGSFSLKFENQSIDLRISTVPTLYDEGIVIRILNFAEIVKSLEDIGLRKDDLEILEKIIHLPNGLILNTGPTGSGKTTTLYSILMRIRSPEIKIITIENPIEYKIENITQTQIDEESGYTFANALRAFLRHDPDVILVGEIRDKETAEIAIQASLTGHLVLSTLHTNDSLGAIPRLISLGVDENLIPPALKLVIAQRLVRRICEFCKEEYKPDKELKRKIQEKLKNLPSRVDLSDIDLDNFTLVRSKGCDKCLMTGYKGRIGIFEFLVMNPKLEEIIYRKPSEVEILNAIKEDFVSLQQDALIKALRKITTIEEVIRVTGPI